MQSSGTSMPTKKGYFTQVPNILLDGTLPLSDSSLIGFLRLWRCFAYKGQFAGSLRKLAKALHMPSTTVHRMIPTWVEADLIHKESQPKEEENRTEMVLVIHVNAIWQCNDCSKLEQSCQSEEQESVSQWDTSVPIWNNTVPQRNESVPIWNDFVPNLKAKGGGNNSKITNKITKNSQIDSLVVSATAESDEGASLSLSSSLEEKEMQPIEAIPEEGQQNGNAPLHVSSLSEELHQDVRRNYDKSIPHLNASSLPAEGHSQEERPVSVLPHGHAREAEGLRASTSIEQDTIPGYAPQEQITQEQLTQPETNTVSTQETKTKRDSKISPLLLCQPRVIREAIDALRGYALDQEGPMKNERKILKAWCEKHTLEHYHLVIDHLTKGHCSNEKHQWWRLHQRMKTFFNAAKLAELAPEVLAELGHIPKPVLPPEMQAMTPEPTPFVGWQPVYEVIPRKWG